MRKFMAALSLMLTLSGMARAHEFWIEPADYTPAANGQITAALVNGQKFKGAKVAFLPQRFRSFTLGLGSTVVDVTGRVGDTPALSMRPLGEGLHVAAYQSGLEIVTYEEFAKFAAFVEHKDQADIKDRHLARGLPETGFSEVYTRYSKSLIGVGSGAGSDRRVGFAIEIVALANPYTDDMSGGLAVQVFYDGAPRANSQVELYEKSRGGAVAIRKLRTNGKGVAVLPVRSGFTYLADSVAVREPTPGMGQARDAAWESLWASLTFSLP